MAGIPVLSFRHTQAHTPRWLQSARLHACVFVWVAWRYASVRFRRFYVSPSTVDRKPSDRIWLWAEEPQRSWTRHCSTVRWCCNTRLKEEFFFQTHLSINARNVCECVSVCSSHISWTLCHTDLRFGTCLPWHVHCWFWLHLQSKRCRSNN